MSSDEMSINKETKPSAQMLVGTSRHVTEEVLLVSVLMKLKLADPALILRQINTSTWMVHRSLREN
jgi:hypothetical protein